MQNDLNPEQNSTSESERHVAAVTAALSILDCFTEDSSLRLKDLHDRTGMQKSRILRLAGSLSVSGYLTSDKQSGGYRLGPKILALGQLVAASSQGIAEQIRPVLVRLSAELDETCFFSVVRSTQRMVLEQASPAAGLHFAIPNGQLRPLHVGATGKILLAFGDELTRDRVLEGSLPAITTETQTDRQSLEEELRRALRQGYLVSRGEATSNLYALAVPVIDRNGVLLGSLSVAGPSSTLTPSEEPALARILQEAIVELGLSSGSSAMSEGKAVYDTD